MCIRDSLGQPHAHLAPLEADEPDLELNWGRIGHVTRKRMKHPCNLPANIIRTWPTRWPGSPDLANFFRIGQSMYLYLRDHTAQLQEDKICKCLTSAGLARPEAGHW